MKFLLAHVQTLVCLAGIGQMCLAAGSTAIPGILKWKTELTKVQPLLKQIFWTYAGYILVINFSFGLVSAFCARELTGGSKLALLDTGFIAVYWLSRISIQFFGFDRSHFPAGSKWLKVGETVLVSLFFFLCLTYVLAFYANLQQR